MRILIIEDETALRERVIAQLREQGYAVDSAADGRTGLYLGQEYPLDAAIVDLGLPDLSGIEVIRRWRAAGRRFPVLILTPEEADGQEMDHPEAFSRSLVDAIQRLVPDLPIEVHAYNQGVPDEALAAAQVVILPAELVARPSEALRLWLQAFQGQRLVIPTPAKGWQWVGMGSAGMPALARQAAQAVRRLAEGDASAQGSQAPWMIAAYVAAAFLGVIILLALILAIVTLVIG